MKLEIQRGISETKRKIPFMVVKLRLNDICELERVKPLMIGIYSMHQKLIQIHLSVELSFNQGAGSALVVYISRNVASHVSK